MARIIVALFTVLTVAILCLPLSCSPTPNTASTTTSVMEDLLKMDPVQKETLQPPEVKKWEPISLRMADYDVKEWQSKSAPEAAAWFVVKGDQWHIDWDLDRKPFDMIVIHHSATKPDATPDDIEAIQKERLYAPRYRSNSNSPFVKGLPVHSGHVINGKERFIGYHHLVYADGKVTTELSPLMKVDGVWHVDHVAWHAGKWSTNCRSVAICLVGDFTEKEPPEAQLQSTKKTHQLL
jgi:hypothetical protein